MTSPFHDHFSDRAEAYAAHRPAWPAPLVAWLAGVAPAHDRAWDCGCGSGQLSALLAAHFDRVVAMDASPRQLAALPRLPRVDRLCARVETSGLADASMDLVVAAQAAHWFDIDAWYAEVRRVARASAVIALVSYVIPSVDPHIDPILQTFQQRTLRPFWPPERHHVDAGYATLPFPFERIDAPPFRMALSWTAGHFVGYASTWSAVRALERAEGGAAFAVFAASLAAAWGEGERSVGWPVVVRAGRVHV